MRTFILSLLILAAFGPVARRISADDRSRTQGLEIFESRVRPILVTNCYQCHGPDKQESSLRLDRRDWVLQGGDSGPAVTPGKPEESLLIEAVRYESFEMPPHGKLPDDDIQALEHWVRLGAPWPKEEHPAGPALGDQGAIRAVAEHHWAFQPLQRPIIPQPSDADRVKNPIDAFVLSKLEDVNLHPSPPADRRTLLRRVTFDLTGLPPTPKEMDAFLRDESNDAYETVVERLLDSPHYGERWARHWLDIARYADTRDWQAQIDPRYPFAYTYRDYVINAFNDDVPYDQFLREQIAADFYTEDPNSPSLAALGLLTVGPRYRNNVHEQIADRIDVVTRGLLGLTVVCARCHDHKYDPVPIEDYYSLYGVFASVEEPDQLPLISSSAPPPALVKKYEQARAEKVADLTAYQEGLQAEAGKDLRSRYGEYLLGYYEMNIARSESIRGLLSSRKVEETAMTPLADNLDRVKSQPRWQKDPVLGPWAALIGFPDKQFPAQLAKFLKSSTGKFNSQVMQALKTQRPADRREMLVLYGELFQQSEEAATGDLSAEWQQIRELLHAEDGPFHFDLEAVTQASRLLGPGRAKLGKLTTAIKEIDASHPGAPPRAMVVAEKDQPITPQVFLRGESQRRGDRVPRRFLSVLAGDDAKPFEDGSGRRELAEAIADPANPLTSRVFVNFLWMHHFGQGFVLTPGDFGLRSDPPSHPELLDWLATTFIDQGWSIKQLHRLIVTSSTYQQASDYKPGDGRVDPRAVDPENRLLWRANRQRLDFESMRDAMLAAAGRLDPDVGGRSVPLTEEPFTTRRTLYGYVDRVNLDPIFSTFDFASPDAPAPERPETLVPQQALFAMNHPFVIEQARALAAVLEKQNLENDAARTTFLYQRLYGRPASQREIKVTQRFLKAATGQSPQRRETWQYGYGSIDVDAAPEERFRPLNYWTGNVYQVSSAFPDPELGHLRLTAVGGHPGKDAAHAVIRRWTAPADLSVSIQGELAHTRDNGEGVRAHIITGRGDVLGTWTAFHQSVPIVIDRYDVKAGETIDFVVDSLRTATADAFNWAPTLTLLPDSTQSAPQNVTRWDANTDFGPPPPPLLTPWEQIAQALMLANEFLYID